MKDTIIKTNTSDQSGVDIYIERLIQLGQEVGQEIVVEKIKEASGGPITNLRLHVTDSRTWGKYIRIIKHRPNSVHMVSSICTTWVEETKGKVFTLIGWEVFHYGGPTTAPNFPAGWIDKDETVEEAALREMSEEMPVLKPEWITSVENISLWERNHASIGWSSENNYLVHIKAQLPEWMTIGELDNHIGWVASEHERIKSQVRELVPEVALEICGIVDKLWLILVWMKENPEPFITALQKGTLRM